MTPTLKVGLITENRCYGSNRRKLDRGVRSLKLGSLPEKEYELYSIENETTPEGCPEIIGSTPIMLTQNKG